MLLIRATSRFLELLDSVVTSVMLVARGALGDALSTHVRCLDALQTLRGVGARKICNNRADLK